MLKCEKRFACFFLFLIFSYSLVFIVLLCKNDFKVNKELLSCFFKDIVNGNEILTEIVVNRDEDFGLYF